MALVARLSMCRKPLDSPTLSLLSSEVRQSGNPPLSHIILRGIPRVPRSFQIIEQFQTLRPKFLRNGKFTRAALSKNIGGIACKLHHIVKLKNFKRRGLHQTRGITLDQMPDFIRQKIAFMANRILPYTSLTTSCHLFFI